MENKLHKNIRKYSFITGATLVIALLFVLINMRPEQSDVTEDIANETDADLKENKTIKANNTLEPVNTLDTYDTLKIVQSAREFEKDIKNEINKLVTGYYDMSTISDENNLTNKQEDDTEQIAESISKKREGIETYENIKTYLRPGIENDSYVVFSTYNIKFYNIDTLVPGMSVLSILNNEGKYTISDNPNDDKLSEYINQLSEEVKIKSLIEEVNVKLSKTLEKDETLKSFIEKLKDVSNSQNN